MKTTKMQKSTKYRKTKHGGSIRWGKKGREKTEKNHIFNRISLYI